LLLQNNIFKYNYYNIYMLWKYLFPLYFCLS
jgi:hypothetical protein